MMMNTRKLKSIPSLLMLMFCTLLRGAEERMFRATYPVMLQGSKYADLLPIGQVDILKTFKPEVIKRFYEDWYRPNLMAVIVVGDIDPAEAERQIKEHFAGL